MQGFRGKKLKIALAGNSNVGKSVFFNQLTGLHQHVANYPGTTVERAEGTFYHGGFEIDLVDLPGIYSLSASSMDQKIARDALATGKFDVIINVVDSATLERNLYLTLELIEMQLNMVIALNQVDVAERKGIKVDAGKISELLGVPVIPTIATRGKGVYEVVERAVEAAEHGGQKAVIKYGREVEERIERICSVLESGDYPKRFVAIKLLEGDEEFTLSVGEEVRRIAQECRSELERIHGEPAELVIAAERYNVAHRIAERCQQIKTPKPSMVELIERVTSHRVLGYPIAIGVLLGMLGFVFIFGGIAASVLEGTLNQFEEPVTSVAGGLSELVWDGIFVGLIAAAVTVLPYIIPLYFILSILEDSGYLPRISFLADRVMHRMGLHGKAVIPLLLGYGCNVPACLGCRIMERDRERFLAAFASTLIPCAARSAIILGMVGRYVGIKWAFSLYIIDLIIVFLLTRILFHALPGEHMDLIMEIPPYRAPNLKVVATQTWIRTKEFVYIAFPLIILGNFTIKVLEITGLLEPAAELISPVTTQWLGLPAIAGVLLIYGVLRKELIIVLLASLLGTTDISAALTQTQMITLAIVSMLYIPCIATIAALVKEFGWKKAAYVTLLEIGFAIFVGGIAYRLLLL